MLDSFSLKAALKNYRNLPHLYSRSEVMSAQKLGVNSRERKLKIAGLNTQSVLPHLLYNNSNLSGYSVWCLTLILHSRVVTLKF